MNKSELEIASLLPLFAKGELSGDESARVQKALENSKNLQAELEEIRSLLMLTKQGKDEVINSPSPKQVEDILSIIRTIPQSKKPAKSEYKQNKLFGWLDNLQLPNGNYEIRPAFAHAFAIVLMAQFTLAGALFWQKSKAESDKLANTPHLIVRPSPNVSWSDFSNIFNNANLRIAEIGQNNDIILTPRSKIDAQKLEQIGKDLEFSSNFQYALYSDGNYRAKPKICKSYKSDSQFENRVASKDSPISSVFSTIESIEGKVYGKTRLGNSEIDLSNFGEDSGWFIIGSRSPNLENKDSWQTLISRFENDKATQLNRENLPLVRVGLEFMLGSDDAIYPGKFIVKDQIGPLNIKYPAAVYNIPGQAQITGFDLKICGHAK